jgi:hypothetical protein
MPTSSDQLAGPDAGFRSTSPEVDRKPGDEAPPGRPERAGENVYRRCDGSGKVDGATCPECKGTGVLTVVIGGA